MNRASVGLRVMAAALFALSLTLGGCFVDYWAYSSAGGSSNYDVVGEEHEVDLPQHEAQVTTEDALRGQGILFETQPDNEITTLWRKATIPVNELGSLFGVQPQYRYEIQIAPDGTNRSKIIINVRGQNIPEDKLASFKASTRYHLFDEIDKLAAAAPPASTTPRSGGVNFALLPGENLKGLAKRVTGNADNWAQIAKDNGLKSPTDVTPMQAIWVRNSLLKPLATPTPSAAANP